jgi:hypothetical protein
MTQYKDENFEIQISDGILHVQWICENYTESDIVFIIQKNKSGFESSFSSDVH